MKVNKILALIGSIIYTINPVVLGLIGLGLLAGAGSDAFTGVIEENLGNSSAYSGSSLGGLRAAVGIFGGFLIFIALITLVIAIFNWVGFAKLQGPKDRQWKVYFMVVGIITAVVGVLTLVFGGYGLLFIIPGVLFILVFALNRNTEDDIVSVSHSQSMEFHSPDTESKGPALGSVEASVSETVGTTSEVSEYSPIEKEKVEDQDKDEWTVERNGKVSKVEASAAGAVDSLQSSGQKVVSEGLESVVAESSEVQSVSDQIDSAASELEDRTDEKKS